MFPFEFSMCPVDGIRGIESSKSETDLGIYIDTDLRKFASHAKRLI